MHQTQPAARYRNDGRDCHRGPPVNIAASTVSVCRDCLLIPPRERRRRGDDVSYPVIQLQMLDRQRLELIIHDESQAEYPAAPVRVFPHKVPVMGRSG